MIVTERDAQATGTSGALLAAENAKALEAASPSGVELGREGLERMLREHAGDCEALMDQLLAALLHYTRTSRLTHDDVTGFAGEIVEGPPGPALWHVLKHRLRLGGEPVGAVRRGQGLAARPATP